MQNKILPALFIAFAALLWGTDSMVRYPATTELDPGVIVWLVHIVGLCAIAPFVLYRHFNDLIRVRWKDVGLILILGICGSSLGSVFYTKSISLIGPPATTLFQTAQPMLVVILAVTFLREKIGTFFMPFAMWVILNSLMIAFPNFDFGFKEISSSNLFLGASFALLAALMWGSVTVVAKSLLNRHSPSVVIFWRWLVACIFLGIFIFKDNEPAAVLSVVSDQNMWGPLIYMGLGVGIIPMYLYYSGLRKLPASVAAFIELVYPITGVLLPVAYFGGSFSALQVIGVVTLILALHLLLTFEGIQGPTKEPARSR